MVQKHVQSWQHKLNRNITSKWHKKQLAHNNYNETNIKTFKENKI